MENSMEVSQKIKTRTPCDAAIPLLGMYPKKIKAGSQRGKRSELCCQHFPFPRGLQMQNGCGWVLLALFPFFGATAHTFSKAQPSLTPSALLGPGCMACVSSGGPRGALAEEAAAGKGDNRGSWTEAQGQAGARCQVLPGHASWRLGNTTALWNNFQLWWSASACKAWNWIWDLGHQAFRKLRFKIDFPAPYADAPGRDAQTQAGQSDLSLKAHSERWKERKKLQSLNTTYAPSNSQGYRSLHTLSNHFASLAGVVQWLSYQPMSPQKLKYNSHHHIHPF